MGRLAKTHSRLSFDELCEEAFGDGLHPWEFYQYDLSEYLLRRSGQHKRRKIEFQEQLISAMIPYMEKGDRIKIVNEAFKENGSKASSIRDRYEQLQKRYEPLISQDVKRKAKAKNGQSN